MGVFVFYFGWRAEEKNHCRDQNVFSQSHFKQIFSTVNISPNKFSWVRRIMFLFFYQTLRYATLSKWSEWPLPFSSSLIRLAHYWWINRTLCCVVVPPFCQLFKMLCKQAQMARPYWVPGFEDVGSLSAFCVRTDRFCCPSVKLSANWICWSWIPC